MLKAKVTERGRKQNMARRKNRHVKGRGVKTKKEEMTQWKMIEGKKNEMGGQQEERSKRTWKGHGRKTKENEKQ